MWMLLLGVVVPTINFSTPISLGYQYGSFFEQRGLLTKRQGKFTG
jgi:hypothetical protein